MSSFTRKRLIVVIVLCLCAVAALKFGPAAQAHDVNALPKRAIPASRFAFIDSAAEVFGSASSIAPVFSNEAELSIRTHEASRLVSSPTVSVPGDIAFTGYHSNPNDKFSFVLLRAYTAAETINFTDAGWKPATNNFDTDEGVIVWTVPAGGLAAGKELTIDFNANTVTLFGGGAAGSIVISGTFGLNNGGDQIYAFTGTQAAPTAVLAGLHMNTLSIPIVFDPCTTTDAVWDGACSNGNNAYGALPAGGGSNTLTGGTNALWIGTADPNPLTEWNNARFNCGSVPAVNLSTVAGIRAAVNNKANWVANDDAAPNGSIPLPAGCSWLGGAVPLEPDINVQGNGTTIPDGSVTPLPVDHTSFGASATIGGTIARTYTIQNLGTANLTLAAGSITLSGTNAADFSVSGITLPVTIVPTGFTTFVVTFDPSAAGVRTATVNIANNDADENPYNFNIQGTGYVVTAPTGTAPPVQWSSVVQTGNIGTTRAVGSTTSGDVIAASRVGTGSAANIRVTRHIGGTGVLSWTSPDIDSGNSNDVLDMVVDPATGDAYIAARASVGSNLNWFVYKVNGSTGALSWTYTHDGTSAAGDNCFDIAFTSDGNVVAVGDTVGAGGATFARAAKINAGSGTEMWAYVSPTASSSFVGVAADGSGNTYVAGLINSGTGDGLTVKLNSSGAQQWATVFNGANNLSDSLSNIVVDSSGDPVVGGNSRQSASNSDGIVIKYAAASGIETWKRLITGTAGANETLNNIVADGSGNLYIAGGIRNVSITDPDAYVAKLSSGGGITWITTKFGSGPDSDDRYQNVRVVGTDVYAVGDSETNNRDILVSRFNATSGAETWSATFNGAGNGADDVFTPKHVMTVLGTDAVALGGQTVDASSNTVGVVVKYGASADLTVAKTNTTVGGTTPFGSTWNWRLDVATSSTGPATFSSGQVIVKDDLPNTNVSYSAPVVSLPVNLTGTVSCSITSFTLTCTASGGPVTLAASGSFRVTTTATPTALGAYGNPRSLGVCSVDPDLNVVETNEGNNTCSDSVTVVKANTSTAVTSSQNPSVFGQQVTFTATVAATAPGTGTPTGTVNFLDGGNPVAGCQNVALSVGQAQCLTAALAVGNHTISAAYSGDTNYNTSSGNMTGNPQVVNKASTSVALTSATNPSVFGQSVTFTATIGVTAPGAGTPTGTVQFLDGGNPIAGCTSVAIAASQAQCLTTALTVGNHTITAAYSGDGNFNTSNGSMTGNPQVVNKASTSVGLTSSQNPAPSGTNLTFTATVNVTAPGAGARTGTVQFLDGGNPIAGCTSVAIVANQAQCMTNALTVGNHTITAAYSGDGNFNTSNGSLTGNPQVITGPPVITATVGLTRVRGAVATNSQIAVVSDDVAAPGAITVTADTVPAGLTITNIVNTNGNITADIAASCTAALGSNVIVLKATDGKGLNQTANLSINVTAAPATFTVSSGGNSGPGTLRQAVLEACTGAVINITAAAHPISLSGGQITIDKNLTINGPGANLLTVQNTQAPGATSRVFLVNTGVTANVSGMTITGGNTVASPGGGILNNGTLNASGVAVSGNNTSSAGGGVFSTGNVTIIGSTISGNTATSNTGGISSSGGLTITNSTISGNTAGALGGGVSIDASGFTLTNVTITNNRGVTGSGGVSITGAFAPVLGNTIVSGNFTGVSPATTASDIGGTAGATSSFNLIGTGGSGGLVNGTNNNQVGVTNAFLAPLGNNGGPTQTHAFVSVASPAIDKGKNLNGLILFDQRGSGFTRIIDNPAIPNAATGDGTDIGAYELQVVSASDVYISGRVLTAEGRGIRGARVTVTSNSLTTPITVSTGINGTYKVDGLTAGETYIVTVSARRFFFDAPSRVITLNDNVADADFTSNPAPSRPQ